MKAYKIQRLISFLDREQPNKEDCISILHDEVIPLVTQETDFGYKISDKVVVDQEGIMIGGAVFRWDSIHTFQSVKETLAIFREE